MDENDAKMVDRIISMITEDAFEDADAKRILMFCLGYFTGREDATEVADEIASTRSTAAA